MQRVEQKLEPEMQIFFLIIIDKTTFFKYYLNNWMGNSNLIMCPQYPNHSMSGK